MITPDRLFREAGFHHFETAPWGQQISENGPGVYVLEMTDASSVKIEDIALEKERAFWRGDENIVFIGRASSISRRLDQFYRHAYEKRSAYIGGEAILAIAGRETIVHFTMCRNYVRAESALLDAFEMAVGCRPFGNRATFSRAKRVFSSADMRDRELAAAAGRDASPPVDRRKRKSRTLNCAQ